MSFEPRSQFYKRENYSKIWANYLIIRKTVKHKVPEIRVFREEHYHIAKEEAWNPVTNSLADKGGP